MTTVFLPRVPVNVCDGLRDACVARGPLWCDCDAPSSFASATAVHYSRCLGRASSTTTTSTSTSRAGIRRLPQPPSGCCDSLRIVARMLAHASTPRRTTAPFLATRAVTCRLQTLPRFPVLSRLSVQLTSKPHGYHDHLHANWQLLHTAELDLNVLTPCTPMHSICRMPWGLPISIPESLPIISAPYFRLSTEGPPFIPGALHERPANAANFVPDLLACSLVGRINHGCSVAVACVVRVCDARCRSSGRRHRPHQHMCRLHCCNL